MRFASICYKITNMKIPFFSTLQNIQDGAMPFLIFIIVVLSVGLISLVITILVTKKKEIEYSEYLKRKFNINRTFIIDFKSQSVEYFSFRNLKDIIKISYTDFLKMLEDKEQNKFNNWLLDMYQQNEILTPDKLTFITDIKMQDQIKSYCSRILFNVNVIDKAKGMIYLDSVLLNNLPSEYNRIKKGIFKKDTFLVSEIARFYAHGLFQKGSIYIIDFYRKANTNPRINEYEYRYIVLNAIYQKKNALSFYVLLNDDNPLEMTVLNTKWQNDFQINREMKSMVRSINEILEVHGFKTFYEFSIVGSKTSELDSDFIKAHETLKNVSHLMRDDGKDFLLYKNDNRENRNVEESYKAEVNKIIRMQLINLGFSPLVKIANKRVLTLGYIAKVRPKGSIFETIDEVKKYALKYNLDKELFSMITRKMIPTFNNEKDNNNLRLFIPIKIHEIQYVLRSLPHMNLATNTKIAVIIQNNDFVDSETNVTLINNIKTLQSRDYEVYVTINNGDYNLRSATYSLFDGFMINTKPQGGTKGENREFLVTRAMLDKLVKFKTPIVSVNSTSWNEVELLVKSGVYLFSSEVIAETSPMLMPVDKRVVKKLLNMYKK